MAITGLDRLGRPVHDESGSSIGQYGDWRNYGGVVYPSLTYRDVGAALAWLGEAFGFEGRVVDEVGALVTYRDGIALIQLERPKDLHGSHAGRGWVYVVIDDPDAHYERAKVAGADLQGKPHDYGDGYRGYSARDLEGNLWSFGTGPVT